MVTNDINDINDSIISHVAVVPLISHSTYPEMGVDVLQVETDYEGILVSVDPVEWIDADPETYYMSESSRFFAISPYSTPETLAEELLYSRGWRVDGLWTVTAHGYQLEVNLSRIQALS